MNHSDTQQPLSVEELMGLVYGEAELSQDRQQHLNGCAICQQELKSYQRMHGRMLTRLYRSLCPDATRLHFYCLDMVPVEERTSIASHLLDCLRCADEVVVIRQQQADFDPFPEDQVPLVAAFRRFVATFVTPQMQAVTRDLASSDYWPRQYHAEAIDISLHLSRGQDGETLLVGILTSKLPEASLDMFEGVPVELHLAPDPPVAGSLESTTFTHPVRTGSVDDTGNILLESIPPGTYILLIKLPDKEILIEELVID